jgi:2-keto-4-pentenoate hydratase
MKTMRNVLAIAVVFCLAITAMAWGQESKSADILIQAEASHQRIPLVSSQNPAMDVDMAYRVQKSYVEKKIADQKIAGFKAGLTSESSQKKFGVANPVSGVLFESGKRSEGAIIDSSAFHLPMIETEIGFVIGKSITQPLDDAAALRECISAVMPVIELPDLGFADMKQLKGVDIIAANVAAKQFIVGSKQKADAFDLNSVEVSLSLDGEEINHGKGTDAFGDQWQAAFWLVNTVINQGWRLEPGQIIITGALGKLLPGKPGEYIADYGDFGKITFKIK